LGLTGAYSVRFAAHAGVSIPTTFTVESDSEITATVPAETAAGPVRVSTPQGIDGGRTFHVDPVITGFTPTSGRAGSTVTISGSGLAGTISVKFNGSPGLILSQSGAAVRAIVPSNATSGPIKVTVRDFRSATSSGSFTVTGGRPSASLTIARAQTAPGLHAKLIVRPTDTATAVSVRLCGPPLHSTPGWC
jgi:hypothetical protein